MTTYYLVNPIQAGKEAPQMVVGFQRLDQAVRQVRDHIITTEGLTEEEIHHAALEWIQEVDLL